jgi:5-methylcytosine-specific restriction endonuclease McrA
VSSKNFNIIIEYAKKKLLPEINNLLTETDPGSDKYCQKKSFMCENQYFVSYLYNGKPLFDILHIIYALNLGTSTKYSKRKNYASNVSHYLWHRNQFNGYILRKLIDEATTYQIIYKSSSELSDTFKIDLTDIDEENEKERKRQTKQPIVDDEDNEKESKRQTKQPIENEKERKRQTKQPIVDDEEDEDSQNEKERKRQTRQPIKAAVRTAVWNKYIGKSAEAECFVGCGNTIGCFNFECGHVIAHSKGGLDTIQNLRPICSTCNKSMGTMNMNKFIKKYGFDAK